MATNIRAKALLWIGRNQGALISRSIRMRQLRAGVDSFVGENSERRRIVVGGAQPLYNSKSRGTTMQRVAVHRPGWPYAESPTREPIVHPAAIGASERCEKPSKFHERTRHRLRRALQSVNITDAMYQHYFGRLADLAGCCRSSALEVASESRLAEAKLHAQTCHSQWTLLLSMYVV